MSSTLDNMDETDIEYLSYADLLYLRDAIDRRLAAIEAENAAEMAEVARRNRISETDGF